MVLILSTVAVFLQRLLKAVADVIPASVPKGDKAAFEPPSECASAGSSARHEQTESSWLHRRLT